MKLQVLVGSLAAVSAAVAGPVDLIGDAATEAEPANLLPLVGHWTVRQDAGPKVVTVDGSRWRVGVASQSVDASAAAVFPSEGKAFADTVKRNAAFPLAVVKDVQTFSAGSVVVRFKPIAGREDQAGGIAFGLRPNGDYLILRGNALEANLILFQFKSGRRSALKEVGRVPTKTGQWHELRLTIAGSTVSGALDGKDYLRHDLGTAPSGRVGLWSKADSVTEFSDLSVTPAN